jgi:hypothetical protein
VKTGSLVPSPAPYIDLLNLKWDGTGCFMGISWVTAVFKYSNYEYAKILLGENKLIQQQP